MAKRSHFDWTRKHIDEIMQFQGLPGKPLLAHLYRRYATLRDALRFWRVDCPKTDGTPLAEAEERLAAANAAAKLLATDPTSFLRSEEDASTQNDLDPVDQALSRIESAFTSTIGEHDRAKDVVLRIRYAQCAPARRRAADRILTALGSGEDYESARAAILTIVEEIEATTKEPESFSTNPDMWLANEIVTEIRPLIDLYESPRRFFNEIAPTIWPYDFVPLGAVPGLHEPVPGPAGFAMPPAGQPIEIVLLRCVWRWGMGVLDNPHVRRAWDATSEAVHGQMLAILDGRRPLKEGRPSGPSVADVEEIYEEARGYVAGMTPRECAEDRTIYGDDAAPREAPRRNPSKKAAARERARGDLGVSERTLRRKLKTRSKIKRS